MVCIVIMKPCFQVQFLCFFMILTVCLALPHADRRNNRTTFVLSGVHNRSTSQCQALHSLGGNGGGRVPTKFECHINKTSSRPADLSLCPWVIDIDIDSDRIPQEIPFAKCRCLRCAGDLLTYITFCKPVYKNMAVWKKNKTHGRQAEQFEQMWIPVPIACACSFGSFSHSA